MPARPGSARYDKRRQYLIARGQWQPLADAGPVRDHIRSVLTATGMSINQFAAEAGMHPETVRRFLTGRSRSVRAATAAQIVKVTGPSQLPDFGTVNALESRRQLQALAVSGWSSQQLTVHVRLSHYAIRDIRDGHRGRVTAATARRIREAYSRLWDTPPPQKTRGEREAVKVTLAYAARQDPPWAPAAAWDDISDPAARPCGVPRAGKRGYDLDIARLQGWYYQDEMSVRQIAALLGLPYKTVHRHLAAAGTRFRPPGASKGNTNRIRKQIEPASQPETSQPAIFSPPAESRPACGRDRGTGRRSVGAVPGDR